MFEGVPSEHDGTAAFALDVRFSEGLGETANAPAAGSFAMQGGRVKDVRNVESGLWRVRVAPKSWKDTTATLAGGRGVHGRRRARLAAGGVARRAAGRLGDQPLPKPSSRPMKRRAGLRASSCSRPHVGTPVRGCEPQVSPEHWFAAPCVVNKGRRPVRGCCKLAAGAPVASRFRPARAFRRPYGLVGTSPVPSGTALDFRWRSRCGNGISIWLA